MRKIKPVALSGLFVAAIFSIPSFGAGNYSENFDDGQAQGWTTVNDTFAVVNGSYTNTGTAYPHRSIAVYNGTTWNTDYTYNVKLNSDFESDGNRVGVVFNYVDVNNYYEMSVSMRKTATSDPTSGIAEINKVINNARVLVGSYRPGTAEAWPARDAFFNVQVVRSGSRTTIKVGNSTVFNSTSLTGLGAGRTGFFAQFNNGRFDAVTVAENVTAPPPPSPAKYLFRSGFGNGVSLTAKECLGAWYQNLKGADVAGFNWPLGFWGVASAPMFQSTVPCDRTYEKFVRIELKSVAGPTGALSRVLSNTVLTKENDWVEGGGAGARSGVGYIFKGTSASSYYIRRYLKYPADLMSKMGTWGWFVQHEYKTGCSVALPGRMLVYWQKDGKGLPFYNLARDMNINCPDATGLEWSYTCYPSSGNCPAMPVGQWFYDEFYVSYPTNGSKGIVKYAINGQSVFNRTLGATEPLPSLPNRVKITPGYLNVVNMEIMVDDLEVLAEPPCGAFPCGAPAHIN